VSYELGGTANTSARAIGRRGGSSGFGDTGIWDFLTNAKYNAGPESQRITDWRAAVRARGNADVEAPRTFPFGGQLAERIQATKVPVGSIYPSPAVKAGLFWYVPAPSAVQEDWAAWQQANISRPIATDKFLDSVQPGALLKDAGNLAKEIVPAITGIPTWAIPVLLIGGGAFVLISAAHSFLPDRRK
jgi:hypothetical protein